MKAESTIRNKLRETITLRQKLIHTGRISPEGKINLLSRQNALEWVLCVGKYGKGHTL